MMKRSLIYYSIFFWRSYCVGAPAIVFEVLTQWCCPFHIIEHIRVLDPTPETRGYFNAAIESALALIRTVDLVRFWRVQREIHSIVNAPASLGSSYGRPFKVCSVDFRCFYVKDDPNMSINLLASHLVYEATLGHLHSKGILRTQRNHLRFDELRRRQAQRFLQRLGMAITPWDSDRFITFQPGKLSRRAIKDLCGVFTRDPSAEATVWKKSGMSHKNQDGN